MAEAALCSALRKKVSFSAKVRSPGRAAVAGAKPVNSSAGVADDFSVQCRGNLGSGEHVFFMRRFCKSPVDLKNAAHYKGRELDNSTPSLMSKEKIMSNKPLNVGLVGGGRGAFIVHPHQKAIHLDGTRRVVAGALFPDPKIALEEAANWPYPIKGYGSYDEMIAANRTLARRSEAGLHPDRHAQLCPLRPGDEGDEGGHRGLLRETALPEPEGGQRPGQDGAEAGRALRRGAHVSGPLDQPVEPLHRAQAACWARCGGWTAITSRAGWRPSWKPAASNRRPGAWTRNAPAAPAAAETSARTR